MKLAFCDITVIFVVNYENPSEVIIPTAGLNTYMVGKLVFILKIEGYKTIDEIVDFFSTSHGIPSDIKIVDFDKPFPFYYATNMSNKRETNFGRYSLIHYLKEFLEQALNRKDLKGWVYYEDHTPLKNKNLNKIHLVYKDLENRTIFHYFFQDFTTGDLIEKNEPSLTQNIISYILFFVAKNLIIVKIKNE